MAVGFQLKAVPNRRHLLFNLLNFLYFRRSDYRPYLLEGCPLFIFIVVPYVLFSEIYFFRQRRYFATVGQQVVGALALEDMLDTLYISNLAVSYSYRRIGVGAYLLIFAGQLARQLGKHKLELSVSKANVPALRLYTKHGFKKKRERRRTYVLEKNLGRF